MKVEVKPESAPAQRKGGSHPERRSGSSRFIQESVDFCGGYLFRNNAISPFTWSGFSI
jgi:hypothetical protein